jgi:hypothetical protein
VTIQLGKLCVWTLASRQVGRTVLKRGAGPIGEIRRTQRIFPENREGKSRRGVRPDRARASRDGRRSPALRSLVTRRKSQRLCAGCKSVHLWLVETNFSSGQYRSVDSLDRSIGNSFSSKLSSDTRSFAGGGPTADNHPKEPTITNWVFLKSCGSFLGVFRSPGACR